MPTLMLRPEDILNGMGLYQPTSTAGTAPASYAPATAPAAAPAAGGGQQGAAATSYLTSFDPSQLGAGGIGTLSNGMQVTGTAGNANGATHYGEDSTAADLQTLGYSAVDPAHQSVGDTMYDYNAQGQFTGTHTIAPENGTVKDLAEGIATVAAFYLGANALFAGIGAGAGGAAGGAVDAGVSGMDLAADGGLNSVDAAAAGMGGGDLAGASTYLSPGEADATLASQTAADGGAAASDGTALTGGGDFGPAPETYDEATLPDEHDIDAFQGSDVEDPSSVNARNGMDFQSDQMDADGVAPAGSLNEGVLSGGGPFINSAPDWGAGLDGGGATPNGGGGGPGGGGNPGDVISSFDWAKFLKSLLDGFAGLFPSGGGGDPAQPPNAPFVPPQSAVGAGSYTSNAAQGGASGSLSGIASTLLTSKDNFGYGRSMLG